ncbi:endolytic transglycosylase MltG [Barnesiella sp. WM24]|uniref:endolytic transglycosylase MltG n=1 Tax=Barnesiella sp. WM24 TaxID=2558278 RepID=UPI0014309B1F|nr:endolytic transglycosylase MltG [Barnesiella sp. WM24]
MIHNSSNKKTIRIVVAALSIAAIATALLVYRSYFITGYDGNEAKWIYIGDKMTSDSIGQILGSELGATGKKAATIWSLAGGDASRAHGAYRIEPGMSAAKIYRKISRGAQTPVKLTFNNVRTVNQLAGLVGRRLETDSAAFLSACDSILPEKGFKKQQYAAAFLPDSYEFYWTASPEKVVTTLCGYRDRFWNDERRAKASGLGLSPVQVAIIASIAEEETNDRAERGTVGRLYLNRVKKGMKLQADPTVKFAVGDFSLRRITGKHLAIQSPYNTYQNAGLPPGPIRIADRETINAILDSKPHPYLYMCAKEDFSGRHNFAVTYAEHQQNAARYHRALNSRNIK